MANEFKTLNELFTIFNKKFAETSGKQSWQLTEADVDKFFDFINKFNEITKTPPTTTRDNDEYDQEQEIDRQSEPEWNPDETIKELKDKYSAYAPGVWIKNMAVKTADAECNRRTYGYIRSWGYTVDYKAKVVNPYIVITWLEDTILDSAVQATSRVFISGNEDKFKIMPTITSIDNLKKLVGRILVYDHKLVEYANNVELITRVSKHKTKELLTVNGWYLPSLIWDRHGKPLSTTIDGKPILQALFEEA
jgi:hypothetical protein